MHVKLSRLLLSACLFLLLFPCSSRSQSWQDTLNSKLLHLYKKDGFPGFSVAVVNKDRVLYQHGFGFAHLKRRTPYTAQTVTNIGSVSKLFLAAALLKGVEDGFFTLDTDINTLLPFRVSNPWLPDTIRIRDLVTHTSTIRDIRHRYYRTYLFPRNNTHYPWLSWKLLKFFTHHGPDTSLAGFLYAYCSPKGRRYSPKNFIRARPGEVYSYSNIGAALAAYLIERKAGISFAAYCTRKILLPLGMAHAAWDPLYRDTSNRAGRYDLHRHEYPDYSLITYPDGGLHCSISELSLFLMEMIRGQRGEGTLLSKESYSRLYAPAFAPGKAPRGIDTVNEYNRGVFWILFNDGRIGHDGNDPGISTYLYFRPATGLGYLFFTNILDNDKKLFAQDQQILRVLERYGPLLEKE